MSTILKVGVIGGFGMMASPMSKHWRSNAHVQVVRVHDRRRTDERNVRVRESWKAAGVELVPDIASLYGSGELDGYFLCVGKNGDDLPILKELSRLVQTKPGKVKPFICHLSTVSVKFVNEATQYFSSIGVSYVNYPLTGGALGAENATMLILCSGLREMFDRLYPALQLIGKPKYFGSRPSAAPEVKLMGHMMVFNGLVGICSAAAVHSVQFQQGEIGGQDQAEFFDFLNSGAGGTKQWEVALGNGVKGGHWDRFFSAKYGLLDAVYTAELMIDSGLAEFAIHSVINTATSFAYLVLKKSDRLATQAIMREMFGSAANDLNNWVSAIKVDQPPAQRLSNLINQLPRQLKESLKIDVSQKDFVTNV